ncbi:MAG: class I SAM-dependent methyltransferase [Chloroflexi bacterium]|nr:class I SAM-dependent methyltransferase [Chloroflexota bacterium]
MDNELRLALKRAYAAQVQAREAKEAELWKIEERGLFLAKLRKSGAKNLLEIGAGIGRDAQFFAAQGLDVLATDLTKENITHCREKGLRAEVMDVCDLKLAPLSFDAAFSLNCLLHIPRAEFQTALENIHKVLKPRGLFYLGLYGGIDSEGIFQDDVCEPKRFFSRWSDEALKQQVKSLFGVIRFHVVEFENNPDIHFQSMFLRKLQS